MFVVQSVKSFGIDLCLIYWCIQAKSKPISHIFIALLVCIFIVIFMVTFGALALILASNIQLNLKLLYIVPEKV